MSPLSDEEKRLLREHTDHITSEIKKAIREITEESIDTAKKMLENLDTGCGICQSYIDDSTKQLVIAEQQCSINGEKVSCEEAKKKAIEILDELAEKMLKATEELVNEE